MQPQWTIKAETKHRLRWNVDFFTASHDLRSGPGTTTRHSPDRRAFAAACNPTDDCAEYGSAADIFSGALVGPDTVAMVYKKLNR